MLDEATRRNLELTQTIAEGKRRGSLLGIEHLGAAEISGLLQAARRMNPQKPRPLLRGKRVLLLFYEASTRTRSSFEIAAKSLGAMTTLVLSSGSSIEKGESLLDTGYTLRAVGADVIRVENESYLDSMRNGMQVYPDRPSLNGSGMFNNMSRNKRGVTANILPPILNTRSLPHCTCSVECGKDRQCVRTHSTFMLASTFSIPRW